MLLVLFVKSITRVTHGCHHLTELVFSMPLPNFFNFDTTDSNLLHYLSNTYTRGGTDSESIGYKFEIDFIVTVS